MIRILLAIYLMIGASGCATYKTREFVQRSAVELESWNIYISVSAFTGSSGASWNNHNFDVFADISTYRKGYLDTDYTSDISKFSVFSGVCPGKEEIDLGVLNKKTYTNDRNRKNISARKSVAIGPEVKELCVKIDAELKSLSSDENIVRKNIEIQLERHESSFPFIQMF